MPVLFGRRYQVLPEMIRVLPETRDYFLFWVLPEISSGGGRGAAATASRAVSQVVGDAWENLMSFLAPSGALRSRKVDAGCVKFLVCRLR